MTDDHRCPECGVPRVEILGRGCASCHEWEQGLDVDYLTWREQH